MSDHQSRNIREWRNRRISREIPDVLRLTDNAVYKMGKNWIHSSPVPSPRHLYCIKSPLLELLVPRNVVRQTLHGSLQETFAYKAHEIHLHTVSTNVVDWKSTKHLDQRTHVRGRLGSENVKDIVKCRFDSHGILEGEACQ